MAKRFTDLVEKYLDHGLSEAEKVVSERKLSEPGFSGLKDEQDKTAKNKSGKSFNPENPVSDNLPKG
jgi:hypothetical protein